MTVRNVFGTGDRVMNYLEKRVRQIIELVCDRPTTLYEPKPSETTYPRWLSCIKSLPEKVADVVEVIY